MLNFSHGSKHPSIVTCKKLRTPRRADRRTHAAGLVRRSSPACGGQGEGGTKPACPPKFSRRRKHGVRIFARHPPSQHEHAFQKQVEQHCHLGLAFRMMVSRRSNSSAGSLPPASSTSAATALASEPSKNVSTTRFNAEGRTFSRVSVGK